MLARVDSAALMGIEAYVVQVEVDLTAGMDGFSLVGLPDAAVKESRDRVATAIRNSGLAYPLQRLVINLAPADTKKEGSVLDLPIAIGILAASGQIRGQDADDFMILGELSLDGSTRPVSGVLPAALAAREAGKRRLMVPADNGPEAGVVQGLDVYPVHSLFQAVQVLNHEVQCQPLELPPLVEQLEEPEYDVDFADVKGQEHVKRALEVAAGGGHNVLMIGPPGSGKTMLTRRLPTMLPPLTLEEALEVTRIYSTCGLTSRREPLVRRRPFRAPHHTVSNAGLVGGGSIPRPGEVSLAHHGVLFLDELPEFRRDVLEVLRQPLEDGVVTISRATGSLTYPARFMLVAAMNPCPCGYYLDPVRPCKCTPEQIRRYLMRISGPLLDRIDLHVEVPRLRHDELLAQAPGEPSAAVRERVVRARQLQQRRFAIPHVYCNAHMRPQDIRRHCLLSNEARQILKNSIETLGLSARAYDRVLKVARTIADLDNGETIQAHHVAEAIQYRSLDRVRWG